MAERAIQLRHEWQHSNQNALDLDAISENDEGVPVLFEYYTARARQSVQEALADYRAWRDRYFAEKDPQVLDLEAREGMLLIKIITSRFEHYRVLRKSCLQLKDQCM